MPRSRPGWTSSAVALACLGLAGGPAIADEPGEFARWDSDADGFINETEWAYGLERSGLFNTLDTNRDSLLDEPEWNEIGPEVGLGEWPADDELGVSTDEFGVGSYGAWDTDDDGLISEQEWNVAGIEDWLDR